MELLHRNSVFYLDKIKNSTIIPFINLPIKMQIKCVFNRKYVEETNIYRIASEQTESRSNMILSLDNKDGKKVYLYETNIEVDRDIDLEKFNGIDEILNNLRMNTKVYPFMQQHEITFKYACVIVKISRLKMFNKKFMCIAYYDINGLKLVSKNISNLLDGIIFKGIYARNKEEIEDFIKMLNNIKMHVSMI